MFFNEYEYTEAMLTEDNGGILPAAVTFRVFNYIDGDRCSPAAEITVAKAA